jgi:hypothetical protein
MTTLEEIRERWSKWGRSRGIRSPGHLTDEHGYSRAVWFIDDNHADCINNAPKDVAFMLERIEQLEKERDAALGDVSSEGQEAG